MKTLDDYIESIVIDKSNLQHIAETGKINGSLLVEIKRVCISAQELALKNAAHNVGYRPESNITKDILDSSNIVK